MARITRLFNGVVATLGNNPTLYDRGEVIVSDKAVIAVGADGSWSGPVDEAIDCEGRVIMPGLINAHTNLLDDLTGGCLSECQPRLKAPFFQQAALSFLIRNLHCGTTTVLAHQGAFPGGDESLVTMGEVLDRLPLRTSFSWDVRETESREQLKASMTQNVNWALLCQVGDQSMRQSQMGLSSAYDMSDFALDRCVEMAEEAGIGFHFACAAKQVEQDNNIQAHGIRVLRRLADFGILGSKTVCANCIYLDNEEIELLAETKALVVHNPQANMAQGLGVARIFQLLHKGCLLGLGSDGFSPDMRAEAAAVPLMQRQATKNCSIGQQEAGTMLFRNNSHFCSQLFGVKMGVLEEGAAADIVVFDYRPIVPITSNNFLRHFLSGIRYSQAQHVLVNGQILLRDGLAVGIDEEMVFAKAQELSKIG